MTAAWLPGEGEMVHRIRAHGWATTPLGAIEGWPQSLRTTAALVLASGHAMQIAWGPERTTLYNDACAPMLGDRHPAALGLPVAEGWPGIRREVEVLAERVFAGETVRLAIPGPVMTRSGHAADTSRDFSCSPVRGETGAVAGLLNVIGDVAGRARAERAERECHAMDVRLGHTEEQLRALVHASSDVVFTASPDWTEMRQLFGRGLVADAEAPTIRWLDEHLLAEDRAAVVEAIGKAIAGRDVFALEHRVRRADGGVGWTFSRAVPVLDGKGGISAWFGMAADVTARRDNEARQAFLLELADALRPLGDAEAAKKAATRLLGKHLGVNRALYAEVDGDDWVVIPGDFEEGIVPLLPGRYPAGAYGEWMMDTYRQGGILDFGDSAHDPRFSASERGALARSQITAALGVGLVKGGTLRAILAIHSARPRVWTGREAALLGEVAERTWAAVERARAEAALRDSEERFRGFAANSPDVLWIADRTGERLEYLSPAFPGMFGEERAQVVADPGRKMALVHPEDRREVAAYIPRVVAGEVTIVHYRVVHPATGRIVHLRDTGFPIRDAAGVTTQIAGVVQDVTDIARATEALRAEKERFRTLAEGIPLLVWRSGAEGRWTWASPQWLAYTGQSQEASRGWGWMDTVHPDDRDAATRAWGEARPHGRLEVEYRIRRASDGAWRWHQTRSVPHRGAATPDDAAGPILEWLGTTTDIEELKRLQAQQQILVAELQHRTRNLLAVVRNVARRSIDASPGLDQYDARLAALGRVQGFLSRSTAYLVPLAEIVEAELHAAGDGAAGKVVVRGPAVELPGESVQAVALALHELATNAVKYGAIAQPAGELSVSWRVEGDGRDGPRLVIDWRETGVVMPAGPPARRGFGTELITRALPYQLRAETALEYTFDGVRCRVILPSSAFSSHSRRETT